ncbi:MAG: LptF/LptG family permease, partial [Longimicrobiales bacterium]
MSILTRYLLRMHAGPFFFALSVLTGLLFVNTVARRFEELAGKGLSLAVIGEVFALSLPHIIALTLPMAVLVAVLFAFSTLAADNEITAIKASGASLVRLMVPLMVASVLLAAGMVYFNDSILPETNHRLANLLMDIGRKSPTFTLKEQVINPISPTNDLRTKYYLQAATIDPATNRLRDVVIYDLSLGAKARTIYADSGRMAFNADQTDLLLTLFDGWVHEVDTYQPSKFRRVDFEQQQLAVEGVGNQLERMDKAHRGDREMSLAMLAGAADSARARLAEIRAEALTQSEMAVKRALAGPGPAVGVEPMRAIAPSAGGMLANIPPEYVGSNRIGEEGTDQVAQLAAIE